MPLRRSTPRFPRVVPSARSPLESGASFWTSYHDLARLRPGPSRAVVHPLAVGRWHCERARRRCLHLVDELARRRVGKPVHVDPILAHLRVVGRPPQCLAESRRPRRRGVFPFALAFAFSLVAGATRGHRRERRRGGGGRPHPPPTP